MPDTLKDLTVPSIHLNGTSKEQLLVPLEVAYRVLGESLAALALAAPNGRDYYPQGPGVVFKAQDEHFNRMHRVQDVREEVGALIRDIENGGFRRN